MFIIEDEFHCETQSGKYLALPDAIAELQRRAAIPWDAAPNVAPCGSWRTCGRRYVVIEYDDRTTTWQALSRKPVLEISAAAVTWLQSGT